MPNAPASPAESNTPAGRPRHRFLWPALITLAGLIAGAAGLAQLQLREGRAAPLSAPPTTPAAPLVSSPSPTPSASPSALPTTLPLRLAGRFPSTGPGTFGYDQTTGPVLGRAGPVRRFQVAVESNVSGELAVFSAMIERALGDRRSWIAGGQVRLQRVPPGTGYDFTIYLVTAGTSGQLCRAGGVNNSIDGRPYTSCRVGGKVVINLERWRLSVPHYADIGVPLDVYRLYVINHEVGHALGHGHELCPGTGRPAPVMAQQTLGLRGCTANPWPYLDGRRYAGPPA